jgi:glycosyltransferase involved in cell wall biosynthesis
VAHTDLVSVLMPAFNPRYLREAMRSVLTQTHENLELLIGDNSANPEIRAIIAEIDDPRVVYVPSYQVSTSSVHVNAILLWARALGRYVRFVYDDDVAYPRSTEALLDLLKGQPRSAMAWHQREFIDGESRVLGRQDIFGDNPVLVMNRPLLLTNLAQRLNFVGEPSFVMFDRRFHHSFNSAVYEEFELRFLGDVAVYLEAAKNGLLVGSREFLGGFRKHEAQTSSARGPRFIMGCVEWEVLFRNELVRGNLEREAAYTALGRIALLYANYEPDVPGLTAFRERLSRDIADGQLAERAPEFFEAYHELAKLHAR